MLGSSPVRQSHLIRPLVFVLIIIAAAAMFLLYRSGRAARSGQQASIFPPSFVGGATGYNNERDADIYPAVATDPTTGRQLAVWVTPRNAQSSNSGFDVYGVFLSPNGKPVGDEFRISDTNNVARNGSPAVAGGNGEFVVAWTKRGSPCQVYAQRVTDHLPRVDQVLSSGGAHHHSPSLEYNPVRNRFVFAYIDGDDYLPPTFFGANTDDCGNNPASTSQVEAIEFYFQGDIPVVLPPVVVSDVGGGSFRPRIAFSAGMNQYLVTWEDRRDADLQTYYFDVYAQRLVNDLNALGDDLPLSTGGDYTNLDTSATWTPRPALAGGDNRFLVTWFTREVQESIVVWSVNGTLLSNSGMPEPTFTIATMPFAQPHPDQAPTGFLSVAYATPLQEFLVGMSTHLESLWGYFSFALIQRVSEDGQLLRLDGTVQNQPGVGTSIDIENDDQIATAVLVSPINKPGTACQLVLYSKHSANQPEQDLNIWSAAIEIPAPCLEEFYLPTVAR